MGLKSSGLLILSLILMACSNGNQILPEITTKHIQQAEKIEATLQEEISRGELTELLENESALQQKGFLVSGVIKRLIKLIMPNYLENFDQNNPPFIDKNESFVVFKGIFGRCYQFRLFYKYKDSRLDNIKWASSILSVPAKNKYNKNAGVVLAPTLDGFSPLVEAGLWLKLCRRGIASLMPESLYQKKVNHWKKKHFDPTPAYNDVTEYTLYEDSVRRYELILNKNINFLRIFNILKTDHNENISDLNVMSVESGRVGFWGSSFGAVVGALVVAKDPQIKGAVLSVGGGDLPYIISHSKIALFKDTREQQMKLLGLKSIREYQDFIASYIKSDPLFYAKKTDAPRLHMILAKKDKSVPTYAQYQLFESFGGPTNSQIRRGHIFTLLYTSWFGSSTSRKAIDSLVEKLGE